MQSTLGISWGFQDQQGWDLQTDAPTSTRPGNRQLCQQAVSQHWSLTRVDLKTAFFQGDTFSGNRTLVCQLLLEGGLP
eukprot:12833602-Prorocentrum_lima.AAC.1